MSYEVIGVLSIVILIVLLYSKMWIGFSMLLAGFGGLVAIIGFNRSLSILGTVIYRGVADYTFAAMPLFILMGMVIFKTGFASDLFYAAYKCLGQLCGGLAMATSIACAILGVVTDSMVAVITMGKVAIPEMKKFGYDESLAAASVVIGASLASLIPPSIAFILYAMLTEQSVGELYIGAIIPGIFLTLLIVLTIGIMAKIKPNLAPAGPRTTLKEKVYSLKYTWAMILIFILMLGGIYAGIFTPTEAGAMGAFFAILVGLISRRLKSKSLSEAILETAQTTAMIVLIVAGAWVFQTLMTFSELPFALSDFVKSLHVSRYLIIAVLLFLYIVIGMFSDIMGAILITTPILFPVVTALGFDPVWYGVVVVLLLEMGFITPPMGMNVMMLSGVSGIPLGSIFRGTWPFLATMIVFLVLLVVFPEIVTFLITTMG